jgi:hypothetical protein
MSKLSFTVSGFDQRVGPLVSFSEIQEKLPEMLKQAFLAGFSNFGDAILSDKDAEIAAEQYAKEVLG